MADYYELLGVARDATPTRSSGPTASCARELHPDANPDDAAAEARFKEVAHAYEVLSDPERRAAATTASATPTAPGGGDPFGFGGGGLGDIFDAFFGGGSPFGGGAPAARPARPAAPTSRSVVDLDFEEAVFGAEAAGDGAHRGAVRRLRGHRRRAGHRRRSTCPECGGTGQVRRVRQSILGQMVTAGAVPPLRRARARSSPTPCPTCRGEGRTRRGAHLHRRHPRRRRHRLHAAPHRAGRGRPARRRRRRPLRARAGAAPRPLRAPRRRPRARAARVGRPRPRSARTSRSRRSTATRTSTSRRGTQPGKVFRLRGRGVPHLEGRGRGDLLRAGRRRHAHRAHRGGGGAAPPARRAAGRRGRPARQRLARRSCAPRSSRPTVGAATRPAGRPRHRAARLRRRPRRARARPTTTATTSSGCCACGRATPLTVADGAGRWRPVPRSAPTLEPVGRGRRSTRAPTPPITVAFALVKGDRPELVVQKLTELGVDRIVPVRRRALGRALGREREAERHVDRLRRVAREAAMQCRRAWLPEVDAGRRRSPTWSPVPGAALADPGGAPPAPRPTRSCSSGPRAAGPPAELACGAARRRPRPDVLRAETAAITVAALLCALRSGLSPEATADVTSPAGAVALDAG